MIEIYDTNGNLLKSPDLTKGRLESGIRKVILPAVEPVERVTHIEVIRVYPNGGKDAEEVVDVEGVEGHPEMIVDVPCTLYIPYTEDELAEIERMRGESPDSKLETVMEMLDMLLSGVTEDE